MTTQPGRTKVVNSRGATPRPAAIDPIEEKRLEILAAARTRAADPHLAGLYEDINQRHFGGALPMIPVMWDDSLQEMDGLVGENYHIHGLTDGEVIVIRAELSTDAAELKRTLCHEAVHVRLHASAIEDTHHGDAFQAELRRVFDEGCFEAILASDAERTSLKEWIAQESARLKQESVEVDATRSGLRSEMDDINRAVSDLNERMSIANARHSGWPGEEEQEALRVRQARAREKSADFNAAAERFNAESLRLNREIERYRLMMAYPRGIDDGGQDHRPPNGTR